MPSDFELKLLQNYEREGRPLEDLSDEDQFMMRFGKIPRLAQRITTLTFMGNFPESLKRLQPVSLAFTSACFRRQFLVATNLAVRKFSVNLVLNYALSSACRHHAVLVDAFSERDYLSKLSGILFCGNFRALFITLIKVCPDILFSPITTATGLCYSCLRFYQVLHQTEEDVRGMSH